MKSFQREIYKASLLFILLVNFLACQSKNTTDELVVDDEVFEEAFTEEHNAQNSLDFQGVYMGILPCADCDGIETTIELGPGNAYTLTTVHLKNGDETTRTGTGTFKWNDAGNIITLEQESLPNQYFVAESMLYHLDMEGNRIVGELEDKYILLKQ